MCIRDRIVTQYDAYQKLLKDIAGAKELITTEKDEEMRDMAKEELNELQPQKEVIERAIKEMLIPKDPNDSRNSCLLYTSRCV